MLDNIAAVFHTAGERAGLQARGASGIQRRLRIIGILAKPKAEGEQRISSKVHRAHGEDRRASRQTLLSACFCQQGHGYNIDSPQEV